MAVAKEYQFDFDDQIIAGYNKALAHAARVQIVAFLREHRILSYSQIRKHVPLSETSFRRHLRMLERFSLLHRTGLPSGEAGFTLNDAALAEFLAAVEQRFRQKL
ncbi:winged helix-turn-helix domain-containing protein [Lewinella sp. W8]|uniref:winged helix-turn-helix domain-containing protein n=1 Tax=Lewinella sp. W8 TaxID=2528208 RepID=UPI0010675944|nr:winged helix-turn-helix domain-containing protein [Lewinella sp. W8]MTB51320.1 helix-turn-helix domain-containing protein [Lewinella sp. W8]